MEINELREFLNEKYDLYNRPSFVDSDPIQVPHSFDRAEDVEISAFLTATIAWGQRKTIIANAQKLMQLMGNNPYEFVMNYTPTDKNRLETFKHRTFNAIDLDFVVRALHSVYAQHGGLRHIFASGYALRHSIKDAISNARRVLLLTPHATRSEKHLSNVDKESAAKRINMFLMWMVRNDRRGVHFGLWTEIDKRHLMLPLDVHTANVARKTALLTRKQNDWKAVEEITEKLRAFDASDPVKYDFALFGLGVFEKF